MRLIEEKYSIQIQIFSLIIISLSTIFSQIANYKIDDFTDNLMHQRLKLSELEQQAILYRQYSEKYALLLVENKKLEIIEELLPDPNVNSYSKIIAKKYIDGEISQEEMVKLFKDHYRKLNIELRKIIDDKVKSFNADRTNGSRWLFWRNYVFLPLQFIGPVILVIGNSFLLLSISSRTKK
ncbi:hypothetical protein [uncultured Desulfobulbus sp.]|uniref:hypothetical protein n=1 Tax=uncultured Desulfobulbus sp. TaxID=239745 RepID=UPI0029C83211|nr:hypothetical protein [uncultured Desulfobulbus sp.]